MAAYRRVYDSRYLQADCKEPGPAPEPYGTRRHTLVPYSQEQEQQKNKNNDATEYQTIRLRYATSLKGECLAIKSALTSFSCSFVIRSQ